MDVNGAKVLQQRLDPARVLETVRASVDVPEDAPPIYHWLGVARVAVEAPPALEEAPESRSSSWLRRLGLGSR